MVYAAREALHSVLDKRLFHAVYEVFLASAGYEVVLLFVLA